MILTEEKRNVFDYANQGIPLVHCIAADLRMGAGIAVQMQKRFGIRGQIKARFPDGVAVGSCVLTKMVINLITKKKSTGKPTYQTMEAALKSMAHFVQLSGVDVVAMPKIGCGLDRLSWARVRGLIEKTFAGIKITIHVCHL